ncbi:hypothetical protein HOO65_070295 [Ceratocystis lukuohia]|uniref:Uncharacterized protein n=1 Tax=Ceratocystis lukuohia TaxID=2019550 RepID=A0ABR4MC32_9PEZI
MRKGRNLGLLEEVRIFTNDKENSWQDTKLAITGSKSPSTLAVFSCLPAVEDETPIPECAVRGLAGDGEDQRDTLGALFAERN